MVLSQNVFVFTQCELLLFIVKHTSILNICMLVNRMGVKKPFISQNQLGIAIFAHGFKFIFVQTKDGFKDYPQFMFWMWQNSIFFSAKCILVLPHFFAYMFSPNVWKDRPVLQHNTKLLQISYEISIQPASNSNSLYRKILKTALFRFHRFQAIFMTCWHIESFLNNSQTLQNCQVITRC